MRYNRVLIAEKNVTCSGMVTSYSSKKSYFSQIFHNIYSTMFVLKIEKTAFCLSHVMANYCR